MTEEVDDVRAAEVLLDESRLAIEELASVAERYPSFLKWCWPPTRRRYDREWDEAKARADASLDAALDAVSVVRSLTSRLSRRWKRA